MTRKVKNVSLFLIAVLIITGSIVFVKADSTATSQYVNLASGKSTNLCIDNAKNRYNYGSAKPDVATTSNSYIAFKVTEKSGLVNFEETYINALTTNHYQHSGIVEVGVVVDLKYNMKIVRSSFKGNMQATNQSFKDIIWQ